MSTVSGKTINYENMPRDYDVQPNDQSHTFYAVELRQILGVLQRRKWVILCTLVIVTTLATAWSFLVTPKYTAEIKVILDEKEQNALNLTNTTPHGSKDDTMIATEIEKITSRSLAQTVVEKLQLKDDPEFNKTLITPSWIERAFLRGRQTLQRIIQPGTPAEPNTIGERYRIIDEFISHLRVTPVGKSRAVLVYFTSRSPEKAAAIVNMLGDQYLIATMRKRSDDADHARAWLAEQLLDLRQKVNKSETNVENYRKQRGLFQGERVPLLTEQMSDMNKRRLDAESARQAAEANLTQALRLLRSPDELGAAENVSPDELGAAENVFQSDLVQKLRSEEAALSSREAAFAQQYGPRHPAMIQIREEHKKLAAEINREINRIVARLRNELDVATRQETSMVSGMNALKRQIEEANNASVGLRSLEREAEANRSLLEKVLASYMETSAQNMSAQLSDVSIVSTAAIPERPSFPRRGAVIAAAATLSGMAGVLLAFFIERIDAGFRSAEQVERETGLTVLAHVPAVKKTEEGSLSSLALEKPYSAFAEAIRSVFTRLLMLRTNMPPPRTVLVTSAEPEEGKSTIAMSLAEMLAGTGQRVLLIDLDFFRLNPAFSAAFFSAGLIQVLDGKAEIGDVIHELDSGVFAVVSGGTFWKYGVLLDIGHLSNLLRRLKADYDIILLDSPPLFVAAVMQRVATLVDSTVFVVRWGYTRREVVSHAVKQLRDCGVNIGGAVLSMVDISVNSRYYRGDSAYYSGKMKHYYEG